MRTKRPGKPLDNARMKMCQAMGTERYGEKEGGGWLLENPNKLCYLIFFFFLLRAIRGKMICRDSSNT